MISADTNEVRSRICRSRDSPRAPLFHCSHSQFAVPANISTRDTVPVPDRREPSFPRKFKCFHLGRNSSPTYRRFPLRFGTTTGAQIIQSRSPSGLRQGHHALISATDASTGSLAGCRNPERNSRFDSQNRKDDTPICVPVFHNLI